MLETKEITKQDILDLLKEQSIAFDRRVEKDYANWQKQLEQEREERKKSVLKEEQERKKESKKREEERKKEADAYKRERKKIDKEFDKKISKIGNTLGYFVEGMVEPGILKMFQERGFGQLTEVMRDVEIYNKETRQKEVEIDLLLVNTVYAIVVEVKTTLTVSDIKYHLKRLEKLQKNPGSNMKGKTLYGAVAGMSIKDGADQYAAKKGLFVLKQKGEIVEIVNDQKFKPKEYNC